MNIRWVENGFLEEHCFYYYIIKSPGQLKQFKIISHMIEGSLYCIDELVPWN